MTPNFIGSLAKSSFLFRICKKTNKSGVGLTMAYRRYDTSVRLDGVVVSRHPTLYLLRDCDRAPTWGAPGSGQDLQTPVVPDNACVMEKSRPSCSRCLSHERSRFQPLKGLKS